MLATDTASRRALRSVGKIAATTGGTIHLDPAAAGGSRMNTVIADELTHIANPSPVARFFDDAVDSPEERRADATARIMARSPLAPASSVLSAPGAVARRRPSEGGNVINRTSSDASTASPGTISAASLAASMTGGASATIQRSSSSSNGTSSGSTDSADTIRRWESARPSSRSRSDDAPTTAGSHRSEESPSTTPFDPDSEQARTWFLEQLERHTDTIVRMLTDQIVVDLERRGGRLWGGI